MLRDRGVLVHVILASGRFEKIRSPYDPDLLKRFDLKASEIFVEPVWVDQVFLFIAERALLVRRR